MVGLVSMIGLCLGVFPAVAEVPAVVVTIKPIHALVADVMRGIAVPDLLVKGQASPHTYALKPSDVRALHAAHVFIRVSDTVEPFSTKLRETLPSTVTVISLQDVATLKRLPQRRGDSFSSHEHDRHDHPGHGDRRAEALPADETADGHLWLDPDNARAIARYVASVLATRYPVHATALHANVRELDARLAALDREISAELSPLAGKAYVVFHDAFQYLEHRYNLSAVGAIHVSPEVPPSGKRLIALRREIATLRATCVFGEPQSDPRVLQTIVEGSTARIGVLDAEGLDLEPGPDLYFQLMRRLAHSLRACLTPGA